MWAQSKPSVGTTTNTAPLGITPPSCNSNATQSFLVSTGSTELSGCPSNDLAVGSYYFPWTMDVNVAGNYSTATYTKVTWQPGGVSSGAYAWYGEMYIYNATTSAGEYYYDQLDCEGVRYANATIYPDKSLSFGSDDVVAQQTVWMTTSSTCNLSNYPGQSYFVIYH